MDEADVELGKIPEVRMVERVCSRGLLRRWGEIRSSRVRGWHPEMKLKIKKLLVTSPSGIGVSIAFVARDARREPELYLDYACIECRDENAEDEDSTLVLVLVMTRGLSWNNHR